MPQVLVLANNSLEGEVPRELSNLPNLGQLQLEHNTIEYRSTGATAALLARCKDGMACSGLPPHSCLAFGVDYRVRVDDPGLCTHCTNTVYSIVVLIVLLVMCLSGLGMYAYLMTRNSRSITRWASNFSILITHLQTVEIIAKMRIAWPQSARHIMSFTAMSGISLEASRPECLFGEDVPLFYVISLSRIGLPLALLFLVAFLHVLSVVCGCSAEGLDQAAEQAIRRAPTAIQCKVNKRKEVIAM
jgi:hypothetical protein